MPVQIITISLMGVNCYLVKTGSGFILIDTGFSFRRGTLKKALNQVGCEPGDIELVVVTHADFDHIGNCAWLREECGVKIAMHPDEDGVVETGRMFMNRKYQKGKIASALTYMAGLLIFRRFRTDAFLTDGDGLSRYGLDARIIHLPGHSTGSIGVLTSDGYLFCGDLLINGKKPRRNSLVDCPDEMEKSIEKIKGMNIKRIYPGHGRSFKMEEFMRNDR